MLFNYLQSFSWSVASIILIFISIIPPILMVLIIRKTISLKNLKAHHDVAGFVFTNLGVLYGVLLGFTVVNVQQRFDQIIKTVQLEASYLSDLYRNAEVFYTEDQEKIRASIKKYISSAIQEEWPSMSNRVPHLPTTEKFYQIWNAYYTLQPGTDQQKTWYVESIKKLNDLTQTRLSRILDSESSLSDQIWSLLILGGIFMVLFLGFFGLESLISHLLMACILSASTSLLLFFIYSMDSAFSGAVSVSPEALQCVLDQLNKNT